MASLLPWISPPTLNPTPHTAITVICFDMAGIKAVITESLERHDIGENMYAVYRVSVTRIVYGATD